MEPTARDENPNAKMTKTAKLTERFRIWILLLFRSQPLNQEFRLGVLSRASYAPPALDNNDYAVRAVATKVKVYLRDPRSPWQRGSNETWWPLCRVKLG